MRVECVNNESSDLKGINVGDKLELKKKIEFICGFCNITPTIINGNIRKINRISKLYI